MEKACASREHMQLFLTGPTDAAVAEPSHSYCSLCGHDVSVPTDWTFGTLRQHQNAKHLQWIRDCPWRQLEGGCSVSVEI